MIKNLLEELDDYDGDEEDTWLRLESANWSDGDLTLILKIQYVSGECTVSHWRINCRGVISYNIVEAYGGYLHYHEDNHPAILQYTDPQVMLHFNGKPESPSQVVADLWAAHMNRVDDWIPLKAYLFSGNKGQDLISGGYGLLADGPKFLIDEYEKVMKRHSVRTSRANERPYKVWDGQKWEPVTEPIAMIHFGESFVVAQDFEANRLNID